MFKKVILAEAKGKLDRLLGTSQNALNLQLEGVTDQSTAVQEVQATDKAVEVQQVSVSQKLSTLGISLKLRDKTFVQGLQESLVEGGVEIVNNRFNDRGALNPDGRQEMIRSLYQMGKATGVSFNKIQVTATRAEYNELLSENHNRSALEAKGLRYVYAVMHKNRQNVPVMLDELVDEKGNIKDLGDYRFLYRNMGNAHWSDYFFEHDSLYGVGFLFSGSPD